MREQSTLRRLVVCADDYGLTPEVDAAVLELAARGRITAVSCMVGTAAWRTAASALRPLVGQADIGLHLDLTESPIDPGLRGGLSSLIARAYLRCLPRARLAAEISAQFDVFETVLGRAPDHVDGHEHVHQLPVVREALVTELARRGHHGTWLRGTCRPAGLPGWKPRVISALGDARLRRLAIAQQLETSGRLLGVYGFDADVDNYLGRLEGWLKVARDGDVLMCHPARAATAPVPVYGYAARTMEYATLGGPAWPALLAAQRVRLVARPPAA